MASIVSHPAVPIALSIALGRKTVSRRLLAVAAVCSILPDIDTFGFHAGVAYGHTLGHRGFTHSILFAAIVAAVGAYFSSKLAASRRVAFLVLFLSTALHGVLDALTTGGLGVAFFSPFSNHRFFLPWRIIEVSPIGIHRFFSSWGVTVLSSEVCYVWLPLIGLALFGLAMRRTAADRL